MRSHRSTTKSFLRGFAAGIRGEADGVTPFIELNENTEAGQMPENIPAEAAAEILYGVHALVWLQSEYAQRTPIGKGARRAVRVVLEIRGEAKRHAAMCRLAKNHLEGSAGVPVNVLVLLRELAEAFSTAAKRDATAIRNIPTARVEELFMRADVSEWVRMNISADAAVTIATMRQAWQQP